MAYVHRCCVKLAVCVWCHKSRDFLPWTATGSVFADTHQKSLTWLVCNREIASFFHIRAYKYNRDVPIFVATGSESFLDLAAHVRLWVLKFAITRFKP